MDNAHRTLVVVIFVWASFSSEQMPVQGGVRAAVYRVMAFVIRYLQPQYAAAALGVPVLPLLFNEALLALGNRVSLHPLNTKRHAAPVRR